MGDAALARISVQPREGTYVSRVKLIIETELVSEEGLAEMLQKWGVEYTNDMLDPFKERAYPYHPRMRPPVVDMLLQVPMHDPLFFGMSVDNQPSHAARLTRIDIDTENGQVVIRMTSPEDLEQEGLYYTILAQEKNVTNQQEALPPGAKRLPCETSQ